MTEFTDEHGSVTTGTILTPLNKKKMNFSPIGRSLESEMRLEESLKYESPARPNYLLMSTERQDPNSPSKVMYQNPANDSQ